MSYPKDLDEYSSAELVNEINRRIDLRERDLCDYCGRPGNAPSCRFPVRHQMALVLGIECDGSDRVGLVLRVPDGVELKPGDLLCGK